MTVLLTACGGGGGSGGGGDQPAPSGPVAVSITEASAKVVGASALEAVQGGASAQSAVSVLGVQTAVSEASTTAPTLLWTVHAARALAVGSTPSASGAAGVTVNESITCPGGGTAQVQGSVADENTVTPGDVLTLVASNCTVTEAGVTNTLNGSITLRFNSGSETASSFQANITVSANAFAVRSGSTTVTLTGEQTLDLVETTTSTTLTLSGASATTRIATSSGMRTTTWKNFSQRYTLSGSLATSNVSGMIESDSTKLGATGGSFVVSTQTPLSWNVSTGLVSSGVLKIVGASNSQMLMTFSGAGVVIDVDANGDGTFEKTLTTNVTELQSLL